MRAAARQFSLAEYSDVSLRSITAEAALTSTAVYNHFKSKDDLFAATVAHMMEVNLSAIREAVTKEANWRDKLGAIIATVRQDESGWFGFPLLTPAAQLKMLRRPHEFPELLELRTDFVGEFRKILSEAVEQNDLPCMFASPEAAELMLAVVFNATAAVRAHRRSPKEIETVFDIAERLIRLAPD